jgi:hypothetical protein
MVDLGTLGDLYISNIFTSRDVSILEKDTFKHKGIGLLPDVVLYSRREHEVKTFACTGDRRGRPYR